METVKIQISQRWCTPWQGPLWNTNMFYGIQLFCKRMRSLIWAFAVRICPKTRFRMAWPINEPHHVVWAYTNNERVKLVHLRSFLQSLAVYWYSRLYHTRRLVESSGEQRSSWSDWSGYSLPAQSPKTPFHVTWRELSVSLFPRLAISKYYVREDEND